jgi:1-acyl-sn-glycerol-3-phosphate acyltransferase
MRTTPFTDAEAHEATQVIFEDKALVAGMKQFLPNELSEYLLTAKNDVHSIYDFQSKLTYPLLMGIQKMSITERTTSGLENISETNKHLYISNHRDIVLDPCLLNTVFHENKIETCEVAIGSNLAKHKTTDYIFKMNRSFIVHREGNPRELYQHSLNLSNYIFDLITNNKASVWIAQREGRAKDGNDRTQQGLIKMLTMSQISEAVQHFKALNIVPVSITYEFDPTDLLKTKEHIDKIYNPDFKKTFQQDVQNMLLGMKGQKGRVNFHFGKPLNEELNVLSSIKNKKKQLEKVVELIDKAIHRNFRLHEINYVAHDLLNHSTEYTDKYTATDFEKYTTNFVEKLATIDEKDREIARNYLLGIYANPVVNARAASTITLQSVV